MPGSPPLGFGEEVTRVSRRERRRLKRCRHRARHLEPPGDPSDGAGPPERCLVGRARALVAGAQEAFFFLVYWFVEFCWKPTQRSPEYWFALLTLIVTTVGVFVAYFAALKSPPSVADYRFNAGVVEGAEDDSARSFAMPKLHEPIHIRMELTPAHQDLGQVAVSISPPPSVKLTDSCFYRVTGMKRRQSCLEPNGEGRVDVRHLGADETLEVTAEAEVVRPIEGEEAIVIEMSSADTPNSNRKKIDLYSPKGSRGEEAAKENFEEELDGPVHWVEATLQLPDAVFEVLGDQWVFLDPSRLHGLKQIPYGRVVDVRSLANNRLLGAEILTFESIVESAPVRLQDFYTGAARLRVFKEVLELDSQVRKHELWCSTTRSSAQPRLSPGDHVLVRAALVGWGLARPFGQRVQAAMLICPGIHILTSEAEPATSSGSGGTSAPR